MDTTSENRDPMVGKPAPDFTVTDRKGNKIRLSDYRGKTVVLETGSLTCPIFSMVMGKMNDLARQFPATVTLALYVQKFHYGVVPQHIAAGMDGIPTCALKAKENLERDNQTVIIDHMDQTGSKTYESTPNMMYIIDSNGTVVYAADWMLRDLYAPQEVEKVLSELEGDRRAPIAPETSSTFGRLRASVEGGWNAFWQ